MIALHARRSAPAIAAWRARRPDAPLVVVLTGTDLYHDLAVGEGGPGNGDVGGDADRGSSGADNHDSDGSHDGDRGVDGRAVDAVVRRSLLAADRIVVLNDHAPSRLPPALRDRCRVIVQSCRFRRPLGKTGRHLRALMVGHLRHEKDPLTFLRAAERLAGRTDLRFEHIGAALDPALGAAAEALASHHPRYRWLGSLAHDVVRRRIQRAHVLVHASRIEGGANVIIEALCSGTPVLASRIDGNLGLLGNDWPATFAVGDDAALARALEALHDEPGRLDGLSRLAVTRAARFDPLCERRALRDLVAETFAAADASKPGRTAIVPGLPHPSD